MSRATAKIMAGACFVGLFAIGGIAIVQAQQTQQLPAGSVTYPVHFPTGAYALSPEDQDTVRAVASKIKSTPTIKATIIGKADTVGSTEFNERLAQKRAEAVFEALVYTNQVPENQVEMHFTGEHLPFVETADQQAELQNRVVAIIVH